jgi:ferritin-like metal-binding protein YciE
VKTQSPKDRFLQDLKDLRNAEKQVCEALPVLAKTMTSVPLRTGVLLTLGLVKQHITRLEVIHRDLETSFEGPACETTRLWLGQAWAHARDFPPGLERDVGFVETTIRIDHHLAGRYLSAQGMAAILGFDEASLLLDATFKEKGSDQKRLEQLVADTANPRALAAEMAESRIALSA